MPVVNKIGKVMKRNHALVTFDQDRIVRAISRAAASIGGFEQDRLPEVNDCLFQACGSDEEIARSLSDLVVVCLNADPRHLVSNFPPTIEEVQDTVLHVLSSYGFIVTADAYTAFRWGHHWVREGAIREDQFVGNGYPPEQMEPLLAWNREQGCDTVLGLNEIVRRQKVKGLVEAATDRYEKALDEAAARLLARVERGDPVSMVWVSGPSCSGKTTTTVKLTDRLTKRGLRFLMLNLDDYFWPLIEHPTDWINDRNYETPEAIDIQLLNRHLADLLEGKAVEKPVYSFKEGRRAGTKAVRREKDQILLLDCLHGFYPPMTEGIPSAAIFRVYIEAMNPLYEGDGRTKRLTRFEDVRLLRRTLRDATHRNHTPLSTLLHWHYVRAGELFSIIPLKGQADVVINGGMPFDLPVLKPFFAGKESLWPKRDDLDQYASFLDARIRYERIARLLEGIVGLSQDALDDRRLVPGDALVREFIGGSTVAIPHNE